MTTLVVVGLAWLLVIDIALDVWSRVRLSRQRREAERDRAVMRRALRRREH